MPGGIPPVLCRRHTRIFEKSVWGSTVQERGGATRRQFSSFLNKNPIGIHTNSSVMACHPVTTWHPIIASHPLMACHRCTPTRTATEERNNHSIILPAAEFPRPTPLPSHFGRTRNDTKTNADLMNVSDALADTIPTPLMFSMDLAHQLVQSGWYVTCVQS